MSKLIDEHNEELTDTKNILDFQKQYNKNLCKDQIKVDDATIKDNIGDNETKLTEFFKFFWKDLCIFILNSINYAYKMTFSLRNKE